MADLFSVWEPMMQYVASSGPDPGSAVANRPTPLCEVVPGAAKLRVVCGVVSAVITCSAAQDTLVRLQDASGTALCCLHGAVVKAHPYALVPGAGVVLRAVATVHSVDGPCLVACPHNIVAIFDVTAAPTQHLSMPRRSATVFTDYAATSRSPVDDRGGNNAAPMVVEARTATVAPSPVHSRPPLDPRRYGGLDVPLTYQDDSSPAPPLVRGPRPEDPSHHPAYHRPDVERRGPPAALQLGSESAPSQPQAWSSAAHTPQFMSPSSTSTNAEGRGRNPPSSNGGLMRLLATSKPVDAAHRLGGPPATPSLHPPPGRVTTSTAMQVVHSLSTVCGADDALLDEEVEL